MITEQEKISMLKTVRHTGSVGKEALLPKFIMEINGLEPFMILDFGCGKQASHIKLLRDKGYLFVYGMDLVPLENPEYEVTMNVPWHLVYASNVLNVQPSVSALSTTLSMIGEFSKFGVAFMSYPKSPRKLMLSEADLVPIIQPFFSSVFWFKYHSTVIFKAAGLHCQKKLENTLTV